MKRNGREKPMKYRKIWLEKHLSSECMPVSFIMYNYEKLRDNS